MDARELPARPSLDQYRKQAKDLVKGHRAADADALVRIKQHHPRLGNLPIAEIRSASFPLAEAQFTVAREYGFETWPEFTRHVAALNREMSPVSRFETAVDAIIIGDEATLQALLRQNPELVRARSTRKHAGTLLHYVSANGVEDYRQKTPQNAVRIAEMLLDAGAEVNAIGKMYGGSTALGLVATSVHPAQAGVQEPLMELLVHRGASFDAAVAGNYTSGNLINACLANGRPEAAQWLASHGAPLDLEGAAGVGRLDLVKSAFDGNHKSEVTPEKVERGFQWSCEYGHIGVVEFLLDHGADVQKAGPHGETALHRAGLGGRPAIVRLLLDRKAPVDIRENRFGGTPLGWALHGWAGQSDDTSREPFYEVVRLLVGAGAAVEADRLRLDHPDREKTHAETRMIAAMRGESG